MSDRRGARWRRASTVLAVCGLVLASAACATAPGDSDLRPRPRAEPVVAPTTPAPIPTPTPTAEPTAPLPLSVYQYGDICTTPGHPGFSGAARLSGRPPHPLHIFFSDDWSMSGQQPKSWQPTRVERVQLVLCGSTRNGAFVRTCRYDGSGTTISARLYRRDYILRLHETRTATVVKRVTIRGDNSCPFVIRVPPGVTRPSIYAELSVGQIRSAFGSLVA